MTEEAANNPAEGAATIETTAPLLAPQPFDGWKDSDKQTFVKEGKVDHEALYKSMDFYRGKVSAGEIPPKEASAYKFEIPDYAKGDNEPHFTALSESFREVAHKHGLTNAQANAILSEGMAAMGGVLGEYQNATASTPEKALAALTERHGDKTSQILDSARKAWGKIGEGLDIDSVGNSPEVIEVLARVSEFLGEDSPADGAPPVEDMRQVMMSEEYKNPRHPLHEQTMRRVNEYYARGGKSVFK